MAEEQFDRITLWVRIISALLAAALLISDYGFDMWRKEPPLWVYLLIVGLALGVEAKAFRQVALAAIAKFTGKI